MTRAAKIFNLAALTAAAVIFILTTQAGAQTAQNCGPRETVVARLAQGYGETQHALGIGSNNTMIEVYASPQSGSWTILVTLPTGHSCLIASGQSFESVVETLPAKGSDI
jgi:hypothetical protein